jgi:hypothetical protein
MAAFPQGELLPGKGWESPLITHYDPRLTYDDQSQIGFPRWKGNG